MSAECCSTPRKAWRRTQLLSGLGVLFGVAIAGSPLAAQTPAYKVIVNSSTGVTTLTTDEVSSLLLKETIEWPSGGAVVPVDLPQHSPVRQAVSETIHQRSAAAIAAHWQRQVFSGRGVPPVEMPNELAVVQFVAATPGAVGYVSADVNLPSQVQAVAIMAAVSLASAPDAVFDGAAVDTRPTAVSAPAVRYPASLARRRVEGQVVLEFVIDTQGRAESESIAVLETTHDDFVAPARDTILRTVYNPGRIDGRAVRVKVQQAIRFELDAR